MMIADALDLLARANLAAGAAILALALLRAPARRHLGAQAAYRLWASLRSWRWRAWSPCRTAWR